MTNKPIPAEVRQKVDNECKKFIKLESLDPCRDDTIYCRHDYTSGAEWMYNQLSEEIERLKGLIDDLLKTGYSGLQEHEQKEFIDNYKTENNL